MSNNIGVISDGIDPSDFFYFTVVRYNLILHALITIIYFSLDSLTKFQSLLSNNDTQLKFKM
jgi:hypothetical protein